MIQHWNWPPLIALLVLGACDRPAPAASTGGLAPNDTAGRLAPPAPEKPRVDLLGALHDSLDWLKPKAPEFWLEGLRRDFQFRGYYAIVRLRGKGFGTNPTTASGETYAVVRLDSALTQVLGVIDTFPSQRGGDYDIWFQPGTDAYPLVVCGQGQSYGDQKMRRAIYFDSTGVRAESVQVRRDLRPADWSSERGCGVSGYINGE